MNAEIKRAGQMLKLLRHYHARTQSSAIRSWSYRPSYGPGFDMSDALNALAAMDTSLDRGIRELRSPLSD